MPRPTTVKVSKQERALLKAVREEMHTEGDPYMPLGEAIGELSREYLEE